MSSRAVGDWIQHAKDVLSAEGIESARLDALLLVEHVTHKNRTHLLAHPELELTNEQHSSLTSLLSRRLQHEPMAYIRGIVDFYGRSFVVNNYVLVPRPESESMISLLKDFKNASTIIDVGTGSGALAITAQLEVPSAEVIAIDIDERCLAVAQGNANTLGVKAEFIHGDLLRPLLSSFEHYHEPIIILANLPYVPDKYPINAAAAHEPALALFGGSDGLDLYRVLFDQLSQFEDSTIVVITEALESQHASLAGIARHYQFTLDLTEGLAQSFIYTPA